MLPTVGKTNPPEKHGLQTQFSCDLFAYDLFSRWSNSKEINSDLDSLRRLTIVPTDTELAALLPRSLLKTALASERITYSGISALYDSDIQVAAEVTDNLETELALVNTAMLFTGAGGITSRAISLGASRAAVIYLTETGITMGAATAIISISNESINQAVESGSMTENQATITRLGIQAASLYLTARAVKTPVPSWSSATNNVAVRQGYLNALEAIPGKINTTLPLREQAMQAFNLRNAAKIDARAAMADGGALLNKTDPIPTIQDVVRRAYQDKGLVGDDMWRSILESSTRSRASVNQALGVGQ